ncbi:holin, phage phi LC3 family [Enterococcus faecalis 13-SD-W-01]|nr:holin, phage phi LC3 family [Enterococcus faecalis 13-SD-W-01]
MKNINWKVRLRNPQFLVPFILFLLSTIGSITHVTDADLSTWSGIVKVAHGLVMNPSQLFALAFALYGYIVDPTTKGVKDSEQALTYEKPKGE